MAATELPVLLVFRAPPPPRLLAALELAGVPSRTANPLDAAQSVSEGWARAVVCERVPGWQALVARVESAGGVVVLFGEPPTQDETLDRLPPALEVESAREPEAVPGALLRALTLAQERMATALMPGAMEERVRRADLVNRFAQSIASQIGLPNVVEEVMSRARDLCDAAGASLLLVDPEAGELRFAAVAGGAPGVKALRLRLGEGIAGKVAQRARPMLVQDARLSPDFASHCDLKTGFQTGSVIAAPLVVAGDVIGVLEAVREVGRPPFLPEHLRRLEDLAPHVAIAVHHARVTAQLRESQEMILRANIELEKKIRERTELMARAEGEWRQTFNAIGEPIALLEGFTIRRANLAYARRAGLPAHALRGKKCHEALAGRSSPCEGCPLGAAGAGDAASEVSLPGGATCAVTAFRTGTEPTVVVSYRDVTRERGLQARLRESERLAALGELASGAAHQINNPLGFLISNLDNLHSLLSELEGDASPRQVEMVREGMEMIGESLQGAHRVGAIVRALRELSRLEIGRTEPCDVNASVSRAVHAELADAERAGLVVLRMEAAAPALIAPLQLDHLLGKILANARQAIQGRQRVLVRTRDDGEWVEMEIQDEGTGIEPEHLNRVFEPFFSTRGVHGGVGLGLTAAYGIARRYGGEIAVCSEPGQGATFTVRLPATRVFQVGSPGGPATRAAPAGSTPAWTSPSEE